MSHSACPHCASTNSIETAGQRYCADCGQLIGAKKEVKKKPQPKVIAQKAPAKPRVSAPPLNLKAIEQSRVAAKKRTASTPALDLRTTKPKPIIKKPIGRHVPPAATAPVQPSVATELPPAPQPATPPVAKKFRHVSALRDGFKGVTSVRSFQLAFAAAFITTLCEVVFMAVGTPPLPNGEPDLQYLKAASEEVARAMTGYRLVVNKSTVPIGSHQVVADWMRPFTQHPFDVASNPEFLKEGSAVDDFLKPDRVVIGTLKDDVFAKISDLYAPFVRQGNPIIWMDPVSAEITKYACNSFLATRISFMNELARLCEKVGADVQEVARGDQAGGRFAEDVLGEQRMLVARVAFARRALAPGEERLQLAFQLVEPRAGAAPGVSSSGSEYSKRIVLPAKSCRAPSTPFKK